MFLPAPGISPAACELGLDRAMDASRRPLAAG